MFADTDFLIALLKDSDWLKENAVKVLRENEGNIFASISVMIEVAILCRRLGLDIKKAFASVLSIARIDESSYNLCLRAAVYMEEKKLGVFDAFHAAYCHSDTIISSDSAYDRAGIKRIRLEDQI